MQTETHYLGLVVTEPDGFLLAQSEVPGRPSVNGLAAFLANALRRPVTEGRTDRGSPRRDMRSLLWGSAWCLWKKKWRAAND